MKNDNLFDNPSDFDSYFDNFPGADLLSDEESLPEAYDDLLSESDGHRFRLRGQISRSRLDGVKPLHALEFLLGCILPRQDVQPMAHRLMEHFDWDLRNLLRSDLDQLLQIPGLGESGAQWLDLVCRSALLFADCTDLPAVVLTNYRQLRRYSRYLMDLFAAPCCLQLLTDENDQLLMCQPLAHGDRWNHREVILNAVDMAASSHAANAFIVVITKSVYRHPNRGDIQALDLYLKVMQHTFCAPRDLLFVDRFHCFSLRKMRKMPQVQVHRRNVAEEKFVNPPGESLIFHRFDENGNHPVRIPISQLEVEERHESV